MAYRTRTYIAGDWDGDKDLIDKLYEWNEKDNLALSFSDAHSYTQARDSSLPCTIKSSLAERLNVSKTFLLVVGSNTTSVTKGSCQYCSSYDYGTCRRGHSVSTKSFIQYECEKAAKDNLNIIVVYNYANVDKTKCPEVLKYKGDHINGYYKGTDGKWYWNYQDNKNAISKY